MNPFHVLFPLISLLLAHSAHAELRCKNDDGSYPEPPRANDPQLRMRLDPGTMVIVDGLVDGQQGATIQSVPLGAAAQTIPTCGQNRLQYKWFTEDRFKANTIPTFTRTCNYTHDVLKDQPAADQTLRITRNAPYVGWDTGLGNMDTMKMDCKTTQQSAFLILPEFYTLAQTYDSRPQIPRVGPYGYEQGDERDPNAFAWPINDKYNPIFTVYEYPKVNGWQKRYPVGKRVCIARGEIPLEQLPTINVTSSEVILQLVNAIGNVGEKAAGISCRNADPGMNVCPPAHNGKAATSSFSVEAVGNFRMRALTHGSKNQLIDSRGTHFSTKFTVSCGTDVNVLFEWFDPGVQLPPASKEWDDRVKPIRRTLCSYTGWSVPGASRIKFGGPTSDDQDQIEAYSSAWNNHNLDPMEWFTCKNLDLDLTKPLTMGKVTEILTPGSR